MGYNLELARNMVTMFLKCGRQLVGRLWKPGPNARVRPALIVMRNPASQYTAQLVLRQRDEKVQALSAQGANDTFTKTVSLGASIRRPLDPKTQVGNRPVEHRRKVLVAIMDEKMVTMVRRDSLPQLL